MILHRLFARSASRSKVPAPCLPCRLPALCTAGGRAAAALPRRPCPAAPALPNTPRHAHASAHAQCPAPCRLWDRGLTLVATSNRHPDALYEGGLQRNLFLPFINRLKARASLWCDTCTLVVAACCCCLLPAACCCLLLLLPAAAALLLPAAAADTAAAAAHGRGGRLPLLYVPGLSAGLPPACCEVHDVQSRTPLPPWCPPSCSATHSCPPCCPPARCCRSSARCTTWTAAQTTAAWRTTSAASTL